MRRLTPAFVITIGVSSACASTSKTVPNENLAARYPKVLNARDANERTIFVAHDGSCYVELPFETPPTSGGMERPQQAVECPAVMKRPAWKECAGWEMRSNAEGDECVCDTSGNPPPPTVPRVRCPE